MMAPVPVLPGWSVPGALALRMVFVAVLAVALSGALSGWLVARASGQEAVHRLVSQQTDEVEMVARLLASKIEQSQKVLRTVASGITPGMLEAPALLQWLVRQGLPAVQFFDSMQVARRDGELSVNLQHGRIDSAANLDPTERDYLRRTLVEGKPMVSELIAGRSSDARVMFTMPLRREDGSVLGVIAGALRLQSQGLLPASMVLPQRGDSRLVVFTRDGTILSHSDPQRVMGQVRDEPGLAPVYAQWLAQGSPVLGAGSTQVLAAHIVSMAGMPLPQWMVARVSDSQAALAPLHAAQRRAWWLAASAIAIGMVLVAALMLWLAQPLARLRDRAALALRGGTGCMVPWPRGGGEVGALVDVFQGQQQQRALQQRQQQSMQAQLQSILDNAPVGIVITRSAVLEELGHQACQMLGYPAQELQGRPARRIFASDADYADLCARVQMAFAAHGAFDGDIRLLRKDGSPVWVRVHGHGLHAGEVHGGAVWILEDMTAAHEARQQNDWISTHDPLTQLANRRGVEQRLALLLAGRGVRGGNGALLVDGSDAMSEGVVLFIDLDHFTVVNDVAGHDAGDDVLRHVARLLETEVRQAGWVARLGGDEFVVVLPGCSPAYGHEVAEKLRAQVQAWEPFYQGRSFILGLSIGLVSLDSDLHDVAGVLHAADMACYDAKRAGRNRVVSREALQLAARFL